ncbi:hypothetical protein OIU85_004822 [Salix viminalis]|uniref:Vacuolar protein sorting-associated protein 62 n=1 Tax=Salix viminalis TaxID=40686 RepID=A0A9Q0SYR9_SALVM|nr:hypothetical protein OIU85_004822 [Salix viminalis]
MLGGYCECFCWSNQEFYGDDLYLPDPQPFSLPVPLPKWPQGQGFATGRINLGEIEVVKITKFESVWSCGLLRGKSKGVTFYRPVGIPEGCDSNAHKPEVGHINDSEVDSPLRKPLNYSLIWSSDSQNNGGSGYFWLPNPPEGYKAMGIVVTNNPEEPKVEEIQNLPIRLTFGAQDPTGGECLPKGVSVGTFYCNADLSSDEVLIDIACLKNLHHSLPAMPNLDQVHALIKHYGPTVFFHPDEDCLPSSVQWFFKNGALLYRDCGQKGEPIDLRGSNLPSGGENDGEFWIDLPVDDDARNDAITGDLETAELYVHVKPAFGGTFTDIAMWIFCPFNGAATLKIGLVTIPMTKIGQHCGGRWVDASDLEFIEGNRPVVYSSKHGHASFPHPGTYLQGSTKLGIGVRNDVARSKYYVDSSIKYQLVAAEYLGDGVVTEPCWLQYMREWGPNIVYDSRSEIDKILDHLPFFVRFSVENLVDLFPTELYGEEGPTGPKEKYNWVGDEIC